LPALSDKQRVKQFKRDARAITIRQMSSFHQAFARRCVEELPDSCRLQYCGALRTEQGHDKWIVLGKEGFAMLSWDVQDDEGVIFTVDLSQKASAETVTTFRSDKQELHVNVIFVDENQEVTKPLARLSGKSVRDVVLLLHAKGRQ
jgi:hypothetical protein